MTTASARARAASPSTAARCKFSAPSRAADRSRSTHQVGRSTRSGSMQRSADPSLAAGADQNGTGTLTLSGANSYTGATIVDLGTLQAGATNVFASTSPFTIHAGGVLDLNNFDQTLASVSGAGSITLGSATLTTGGDNTNTNYSGGISGTGGLTKNGTGTFTLSGTVHLHWRHQRERGLSAGRRCQRILAKQRIYDCSRCNPRSQQLQPIDRLARGQRVCHAWLRRTGDGNDNTNTTFSGGISGSGGLTKIGSGTFTLSGASSYIGATTINAGTLQAGGTNVFAREAHLTLRPVQPSTSIASINRLAHLQGRAVGLLRSARQR